MAARAKQGKTRDARSSSAGPRKDRKVLDRRRRSCFFCREKIAAVDYKNITQLRRFISERGKIKGIDGVVEQKCSSEHEVEVGVVDRHDSSHTVRVNQEGSLVAGLVKDLWQGQGGLS